MFIKDVKITGGIHNRDTWYADVTEEQLAQLHTAIHCAIAQVFHTQSAWINVDYTKSIGSKINH